MHKAVFSMSVVHHLGYWQPSWLRSNLQRKRRIVEFWGQVNSFLYALVQVHTGWGVSMISGEWVVVTRSWNCFNRCCRLFSAFPVSYASNSSNPHAIIGPDQMQSSCIDNHLSTREMRALSHVTWHTVVTRATCLACRVSTSRTRWSGTDSDILHSILIWQQKILWHQIGRWCRWCNKFKWFFQDSWFNVLMEFWMSGRDAVHCNILWFSIKFPGCSVRFIGDHNCVTPHCFPQIESEEEFSSDQDRPARYLLGRLPGNLTDYAIITHKIKIICISYTVVYCWLLILTFWVKWMDMLLQPFKIPLAYSQHHLCHCICQITPSWESKSNFQHFCLWISRQVSF